MQIIETNFKWNGSLSYTNKPKKIVLHHAEASICTVQQIHSWHLGNGWSGIGYHFFVRKDGTIYRGRPENAIGAHVSGANTNTLGICAEGSYMTEIMPTAQLNAIKWLIQYLDNKYEQLPIYGHREVGSSNSGDDWVRRLQQECNNQGFSNQKVDGIAGVNTLNGCPTLRQGASGNITKLLQERLGVTADGIFGGNTRAAVIGFQNTHGLSADGIVGKNTWRKLLGL